MDNNLLEFEVKSKIFNIRNSQVILDRDLAKFYEIKSIRLREQIKRNIERFPKDFMFQLSDLEVEFMVSQNAIPSKKILGGSQPYVFTEKGVAMLSGILRSKKAIEINIEIMRAFISMKNFLLENNNSLKRLNIVETKLLEHDNNFSKIFDLLNNSNKIKDKGIFFDGEFFDSYKFVSDLIRKANNKIILIDNYIDERTLNLFTKKNKNVILEIYSKTINNNLNLDIQKFEKQYGKIFFKNFYKSHDRFLIIDDKETYHIGASLKDLGKKWFAFSKLDLKVNLILDKLK